MARYDLAVRTLSGTIAEPALEIRATSSDRPRVVEIDLLATTAVAATIGLGVPALIGITPTTPLTLLNDEPADPAASVTLATAWTTKPTVPSAFYRRFGVQAQIGGGFLYAFPKGLVIAQSSGLVLWNITAAPLFDVSMSISE